ncbi:hypothetical protein GLYMA_16G220600v4 [Glycine max]|uniref:Uncharacterized protein n=1 Tax=Glycine max TaxID=3847 RepID=K7MJ33_SOYBN|nr:mucin-5AC [Glycine max]KAH1152437.1 hypothetical protein GYH30_045747 [Glycine max]KAH1207228.1 hypothetical protein GmHk_16G047450 [Glycine max]KRH09557.1 hypothetical protein GLYMA_16G220600v4 [Glycine max]|eukprot:XP_003549197.1 mucin-5AC [Glycine max]
MNSRNVNVNQHHHRRGHSFNGSANIHPISNTINSSHGKLGKLSFESAKLATSGIDDLLSSTEGGKHDYDWLLTPPGTPHLPSSEGESQPTLVPPRSSLGRLKSNISVSRLSVSQSENNNHSHSHSRPSRSGSVTRSPNRSSSILNTRPSSPITAARLSTPTSRTTSTSTPPRVLLPRSFPSPINTSSTDTNKTRTSQGSRPSTPSSTSKPSIPATLRPSTPTRRHSLPSPSPSVTRVGRNPATPRLQPVVPPDFPLETPPNLRTTLPADRPVSAGRSRPGAVVTLPSKPNSEMQAPVNMSRRQPSPIANRGRLSEYTAKSRGHANAADASEVVARRSAKSSTTASENNVLGRTISKKSLDMAIRHMDVRNSSGTLRSVPSATLYPQSIRTSTPKTHHTRGLSVPVSMNINGSLQSRNNNNNNNRKNGREIGERQKQYLGKLSEVVDVYESYRYDSLLLKEDLNNTNWLRSVDDKCDQGPIFDNGFEYLPEPFGLF